MSWNSSRVREKRCPTLLPPESIGYVREIASVFEHVLNRLAAEHAMVASSRGVGVMRALELTIDATPVVEGCAQGWVVGELTAERVGRMRAAATDSHQSGDRRSGGGDSGPRIERGPGGGDNGTLRWPKDSGYPRPSAGERSRASSPTCTIVPQLLLMRLRSTCSSAGTRKKATCCLGS